MRPQARSGRPGARQRAGSDDGGPHGSARRGSARPHGERWHRSINEDGCFAESESARRRNRNCLRTRPDAPPASLDGTPGVVAVRVSSCSWGIPCPRTRAGPPVQPPRLRRAWTPTVAGARAHLRNRQPTSHRAPSGWSVPPVVTLAEPPGPVSPVWAGGLVRQKAATPVRSLTCRGVSVVLMWDWRGRANPVQ